MKIIGHRNTIVNSIINSTHGTGIHVTGNYNNITKSVLNGSEWAVYIGNGTKGESIGNTIMGSIMVQGSHHVFANDVINGNLLISECSNTISNVAVQSISESSYPPHCTNVNNFLQTYAH